MFWRTGKAYPLLVWERPVAPVEVLNIRSEQDRETVRSAWGEEIECPFHGRSQYVPRVIQNAPRRINAIGMRRLPVSGTGSGFTRLE